MKQTALRALAKQDLTNIWLYSFQNWGEGQADHYLDELINAIERLARRPLMGRERQEFIPTVRIHHHASHLIVYVVDEDGIDVIRVLHQSMDVDFQLNL